MAKENKTAESGPENPQVETPKIATENQVSVEELQAQLKAMQEQRDKALEKTAELAKKIDLQEKHGKDGIVVTINGNDYKLLGNRFVNKKGEMTAEQLLVDQEELERMVEKGSGSLIPIN